MEPHAIFFTSSVIFVSLVVYLLRTIVQNEPH